MIGRYRQGTLHQFALPGKAQLAKPKPPPPPPAVQ